MSAIFRLAACATIALSVVSGLPAPAHGDEIIYDNGTPTPEGGSMASDFDFPSQHADDFVLGLGATTVRRFDWWGQYLFNDSPTAPDDFTIRLFGDNGDAAPLAAPFYENHVGHVGRTNSGPVSFDHDTYYYSVAVPPISLVPDVRFWLSIVNNTTADTNDNWFWSRQSESFGLVSWRINEGAAWNNDRVSTLAFQLFVPEPAVAVSCGAGALMLTSRRRR